MTVSPFFPIILVGIHVSLISAQRLAYPDIFQNKQCQRIDVPLCTHYLSYNRTLLPNILGHRRQHDISLELNNVFPVIRKRCHPRIGEFLCSLYFPQCTYNDVNIVPPCRSLCLEVAPVCREELEKYGFKWPEILNCDRLPSYGPAYGKCYEQKASKTQIKNTEIAEHYPSSCRRIDTEICKDVLPYRTTRLPNVLWHKTKQEFDSWLYNYYEPILQMNCSAHLKQFLCNFHLPECTKDDSLVLPCRSLCLLAMSVCRHVAEQAGFIWPDIMNCQNMPESGLCFAGTQSGKLHDDGNGIGTIVSKKSGETINVQVCKSMPYKETYLPNMLGHRNQNDTALEINQFIPLITVNCSLQLRPFICSLYLPPAPALTHDSIIRPCRTLCQAAKDGCETLMNKFGFHWPMKFACERFPSSGLCFDGDSIVGQDLTLTSDAITIRPAEQAVEPQMTDACEPLTSSVCKDILPYSTIRLPNALWIRRQSDIEAALLSFGPIIQMNCSPHLGQFLCGLYLPECKPNNRLVLPCRSLCLLAMSGCRQAAEQTGYIWSKSLDCERLPDSGPCFNGTSTGNMIDDVQVVAASETDKPRLDDIDKATNCTVGEFECRHSTSHAHIDGGKVCCFDERTIYFRSACHGSGRNTGTSMCKCIYPTPADVPGTC